mgnify:CR=1 FL=1|jgi:hypothetical protein|tara:strand:- start:13 stop:6354 length:6342 start_codon:yes stop_codon:yes gene_type:complete
MADTLKPDPSRIARRLSSSTTGGEEVFEYDLLDYEPQPLPETEEVEYEEVIDYIDRTGEKVQVPVYNESGKKIYRPTYNEQGVMTHDERGIMTFDEWKRKSEEGVDWWPIAKEAVAGLARGFTKIPGKIEKEGFMEASANIPESFLAATEGLKLIGGGVGRFVAKPFRSDEEEDAAEYAAYKEFGNQIFRQLELRKSRMGDVARLFGAEDLAAVYDDGIDPEIADSLSLIFDPTYLVGGGLVKVGAAAAKQAPKVTNKYAKKLIEAAGKAAETQAAKQVGEFLAKPVTSTVSGIGTGVEKVGRGVQKVGEAGAKFAEKAPKTAKAAQMAVGAGTGAVLAPEGQELTGALGGAFGGKVALSSKAVTGLGEKIEKNAQRLGGAAQAAKINSLRTSGLGTVAKIRPMREEVAKQFVTLDNRVANRLLSEAGKLADTALIGAGMGAGIGAFMPYDPTNPGYIAGMALGTLAAPAGMYSAEALNQLARVELAKGAVPDAGLRLRLKETPMHKLASEAVVKRFISALPEQQRVRFVDPDRGLSVADLANQAEAVDLFMGAMRDKGKDVNFFIGNTPEILEKTGGTAREGVAGFYDPDSNTVFVNTDAETPSFTLFHELFHPTERWSAMRKDIDADTGETVKSDPLQDIQTDLAQTIFGTYGPDGEVIQPGLYSKKDMLSFADQYNSRLYPDLSAKIKEVEAAIEAEKKKTLPEIDGIEPPETPEMRLLNRELEELQTRQEDNQKELAAFDALPDATKRDYMARELMSDYFAMFGESARHGIIRKARNITLKKDYFKDKFLGMNIDRLKMATLGNLRKLLERSGVEFDLAGNPRGEMTATSALFKDRKTGRELVMSPQIEHLIAQYITEKDKLVNRVSETDDVGGSEITLNAKDVLKKNPDGTPKIPEAEIKRWASSGWLKTDKEGNVLNSTGGRWQPGQRPAFTTARERTRMDKNRVAALVTALTPVTEKIAEGDPGSLTVKARETADGGTNFRGSYFDEQQMDAIMATPDDVIHPDLKSVIKTMNDAIKEGKGAPFLADYWKAITGRGYDSKARMKVQLFTPIGMQISSAGNFNATVFNIGYFENKINRWLGQAGKKKFWSDWADADGRVDVDSFRTDMMELLKTHYENDPSKKFPEGMKKEKLYSFLGVKPEDLSRKDWNRAAKDFKLFISLRFDRMKDVTRGMGDNFPVNYYKAKQRFMPATAEPRPAQDKLGFFSRVEQVASGNKIPNRGTGEQMLATIAKQPGVKQEEIAWLGLEDFLRGKKQVTKDELVEFIRENDVQLEETMLAEGVSQADRDALVDDYVSRESDKFQILYDESEKSYLTYDDIDGKPLRNPDSGELIKYGDPDTAMDELKLMLEREAVDMYSRMTDSELMRDFGREGEPTKYQEYQLPGAEPGSYRELLLRLPETEEKPRDVLGEPKKIPASESYTYVDQPEVSHVLRYNKDYEIAVLDNGDYWVMMMNDDSVVKDLSSAESVLADYLVSEEGQSSKNTFRSSHFSEPNILSHVRFNDRTGPDGEKILFLEELQSDWHQEGRKLGYARPEISKLPEGYYAFQKDDGTWAVTHTSSPDKTEVAVGSNEGEAVSNAINKYNEVRRSERGTVPDAPFKSSWHELTLKRMLRYAAENGYDKLAFIDGKETADRYDLSKRVDKVAISDDETGNLTITADDSLIASDVEPNQLERYVGKEVAQRALQSIEDTSPDMSGNRTTVLTDSDLKVGGQWAFNLYDRMIPQFLNKYGKKFGAKVEDFSTSIPDEPFLPRDSTFKAIDITPQMRGEEGVLGGQVRFMPGIERVANNEPGLAAETVKIRPGALDGVRFMPGTKVPKITLEKIVESDPFIITADSMADMTYTVPDSGVEIKLHGGPMFSYRPGRAVWASNKGAASRIGNFVERTGQRFALIMLQNGTNHAKNKSMGQVFVEELKARSGAKKIKQGDLKKMLKFASDRAGLEKPIKNLAELEDFYAFWDWDTRGNFFKTFGLVRTPIGDPKKAGFFDYNQIVRDTTQPEFLDKPTGTIVGAIEFKSGKRFSAEELGAEPHSSYDTMLEGRGVGLFKNPPHISDVLDAPESQRSVFTLQKRLSSPNRLREAADAEKKLNAIRRHRNKNAVRNTKKAQ